VVFSLMEIGGTLFIVISLIVFIYILIEVKRFKHKIFALFLIGLILFSYLSAAMIFKDKEVDLKTIPGVIAAGRIYFSWLGTVFTNTKQITSNVVSMDWGTNKSVEDTKKKPLFNFLKSK